MRRTFTYLICILLFVTACQVKPTEKQEQIKGRIVALNYAKGFSITHTDHYSIVDVFNPWNKGNLYSRYYLVKDSLTETPSDGTRVKIPIKSLMTNSATHLTFIELLGELDKVTGVSDASYIYNAIIREKLKSNVVKDLGQSFNLNIEQLLLLHPQAIMTTAYNAKDENSRRMEKTGISLLYNIEWQEPTLLGRAEWIKFVAAFFDKEEEANQIFREVETNYNQLKAKVINCTKRPTIFSGQDFRGNWQMAGGKSYTAQLFRDAAATYFYENDSTFTSISGTIEQALMNFSSADIWIGVQANSLSELEKIDAKYKLFKAFKDKKVYSFNNRTTPQGGNDYWESGVARPDLLLADMIKICHPELLPVYEFTYYKKLTE